MNSVTILYVEDEESDVMLLQHALAKTGIQNPLQTVKAGKRRRITWRATRHLASAGCIRCRAWCCWT